MSPPPRTWTRDDGFVISTDASLIPLESLNAAFASPQLYWAKSLPISDLRALVDNSLCFALYHSSRGTSGAELPKADDGDEGSTAAADAAAAAAAAAGTTPSSSTPTAAAARKLLLVGFARLVTDHVTISYLTDVYVLPEWQARGLGRWLIACVQEVVEGMPHLRRSMAITRQNNGGDGQSGSGDNSSSGSSLVGWYERTMKMRAVQGTEAYVVLEWRGRGNVF